jgi:hypothetical protein
MPWSVTSVTDTVAALMCEPVIVIDESNTSGPTQASPGGTDPGAAGSAGAGGPASGRGAVIEPGRAPHCRGGGLTAALAITGP